MSHLTNQFEWIEDPPDPIDKYCDILPTLNSGAWDPYEVMINFLYIRTSDKTPQPIPSMPKMYTTFGQIRTLQTLLNEIRNKVDAYPYDDLYSLRIPEDIQKITRMMRDKRGNKVFVDVELDLRTQDGNLWYPLVKRACRPENHTYFGEVGWPAVDVYFDSLQIEVTGV